MGRFGIWEAAVVLAVVIILFTISFVVFRLFRMHVDDSDEKDR